MLTLFQASPGFLIVWLPVRGVRANEAILRESGIGSTTAVPFSYYGKYYFTWNCIR